MHTRLAMIVLGTTLLTVSGCTQDPTAPGTTTTDPADIPPVPENVALTVSPHQIVVSWTIPAGSGVTNYRVYRAEGTGTYDVLGTTANQAYTDNSVATATTYHYQVAAVKGGLESERSVTVTATPNVHAIVLDGGVAATAADDILPGSRQIVVGLVAPETTVSFQLSESATLAGAAVQSFDAAEPIGLFALSPGDGMKTVYARFTDADGSVSGIVSASIILDTKAVIESVTEDSGGSVLGVNDVLHVAVTVDATGGIATVTLPGVLAGANLFDDGTHGDATALDGVYERDFVIPAGVETRNRAISAAFTDEVGNVAAGAASATLVTVADPPAGPAWLTQLNEVRGTSIDLYWTKNLDADFAEYRIYRSLRALPADPDPTVTTGSFVVAVITDRAVQTLTDGGFPGGGKYTWGIVAVDANGFLSTLATVTETVGYDPVLTGNSLTPPNASSGTTFTWNVTYSHGGNVPPASVNVVVDGTLVFPMTRVSGGAADWVGGEAYAVQVTGLTTGSHTHRFETEDANGLTGRFPATGSLAGPLVTP